MPSLIIEQPDKRSGGLIAGRVLIGRLPTNGILVPESNVSRLHAWIDTDADGHHFVADGGSLGGTWVNGRAIEKRRLLGDGDVIRVGTTQIVYSIEDPLPDGVDVVDLAGSPPGENVSEAGVLFYCPCGAPVWFKAAAIGQIHVCRQCARSILIPAEPNAIAEIVSSTSMTEPGMPPSHHSVEDHFADLLKPSPVPMPHPTDEYGLAEVAETVSETPVESVNGNGLRHSDVEPAFHDEAGEVGEGLGKRESLFQNWRPGPLPELASPVTEDAVAIAEQTDAVEAHVPEQAVLESPAEVGEESPASTALEETCSICHSAINAGEHTTPCPSCGLTFHADCWQENLGCSAYGCPQVSALQPPEVEKEPVETIPSEASTFADANEAEVESATFPWEFVFVALSVIGSLLGALAYGMPALIGAIGTAIYLAAYQDSRQRRVVAIIALVVCILGAAGGIYVSYIWWNGWPPIGPWAHVGNQGAQR